jgi:hypothetical protein
MLFSGFQILRIAFQIQLVPLHYGDYSRVLECYSRQCAVEELRLGPGSVALAATLCNLANAHIGTGRYAEVLPFFERALAIVAGLYKLNSVDP